MQVGADCIIKSVRNASDYVYEADMAYFNKRLCGIETLLLPADEKYIHLSSGFVRELIKCKKTFLCTFRRGWQKKFQRRSNKMLTVLRSVPTGRELCDALPLSDAAKKQKRKMILYSRKLFREKTKESWLYADLAQRTIRRRLQNSASGSKASPTR